MCLTESDLGIREDDVTRVAQNAQEVKVSALTPYWLTAPLFRVPAPSGAALRLKLGSSFSARAAFSSGMLFCCAIVMIASLMAARFGLLPSSAVSPRPGSSRC